MTEELIHQIATLKKRRNALIVAHNYQRPEVQDVADVTGDSLELSRLAARTDADVIVFCGVHFMAETAKILAPDKVVLLPDPAAGCPMADMVTVEDLLAEKARHPEAQVVCYVNSSAAVKACADVCCTSANARAVVSALGPDRPVLFVPDQHLSAFVTRHTGRALIPWEGHCATHLKISAADIRRRRIEYPGAEVLAHPECWAEVSEAADHALGTGGMLRFARDYTGDTLIIATETGLLHPLTKVNPRVRYVSANPRAVCPNMKRTTLEKILRALTDMAPRIELDPDLRHRARRAVDRMLQLPVTEGRPGASPV